MTSVNIVANAIRAPHAPAITGVRRPVNVPHEIVKKAALVEPAHPIATMLPRLQVARCTATLSPNRNSTAIRTHGIARPGFGLSRNVRTLGPKSSRGDRYGFSSIAQFYHRQRWWENSRGKNRALFSVEIASCLRPVDLEERAVSYRAWANVCPPSRGLPCLGAGCGGRTPRCPRSRGGRGPCRIDTSPISPSRPAETTSKSSPG
jgi:hypothetical protein